MLPNCTSGLGEIYSVSNMQLAAFQGTLLSAGGLFNLVDYSVHANPLPMRNAKDAVELLEALPYIRVDMADHTKDAVQEAAPRVCLRRIMSRASSTFPWRQSCLF